MSTDGLWLETRQSYSLAVLEATSTKSVPMGCNQGVRGLHPSGGPRDDLSPASSSSWGLAGLGAASLPSSRPASSSLWPISTRPPPLGATDRPSVSLLQGRTRLHLAGTQAIQDTLPISRAELNDTCKIHFLSYKVTVSHRFRRLGHGYLRGHYYSAMNGHQGFLPSLQAHLYPSGGGEFPAPGILRLA